MDDKKQKLLIEYLISSPDTFAICQGIVKHDYFDPQYRNAVKFIKQYYDKYNTTPTPDQIEAETDVKFGTQKLHTDQIEYASNEVEAFCRRRALEKAILSAPELMAAGDYGKVEQKIRDAILVSLNKDLGTRYFDTVEQRLQRMLNNDPTEPTGWAQVDELLYGGITRGELLLLSANSGGGKSLTLANLAANFVERGRHVLYISLELSENIVAQRFDTMFTGIGRKEWKQHVSEIATKIESLKQNMGRLDIKYMPSGTKASEIKAYLKEYYLHYKHMPDMIIVDYLDNMSPNENVSADNVWEKDKRCSEQLRQIGVDHNMFVATASQLNRDAVKAAQHDHSHIAGGISKINVSDVYISIKMSEAMRAKGEILFSFQKTRNSDGVGKQVFLKYDKNRLRIIDKDDAGTLNFATKDKSSKKDAFVESKPTGNALDEFFG